MRVFIVLFGLCLANCYSYIIDSGPRIRATIGEVWPQPLFTEKSEHFFKIDPHNFEFVVVGYTCDILQNALVRYKDIIKLSINSLIRHKNQSINRQRTLTKFYVNLTSTCERKPHIDMDEWYYIATGSGRIMAHSIWGILRGLETFSQLITPDASEMLQIADIRIRDAPRFPHRGLLLDTSRHYINVDTILKILDGMSFNKLNVFHWHIVDDESFPYQSIKYPELSGKGAYLSSMIYTQRNISDIIEYARMRGIRVVAEFDVPGHTRSWGNSHQEILTECGLPYAGKFGPLNPINNTTYDFLENFFSEVIQVFPDKFMHLGGDEVGFECWESNNEIRKYVTANNITFTYLQKQFMERVSNFVANKSIVPIVWQEAMVKSVEMPKETVIQVWTGDWKALFRQFTSYGYRVLLSECWYLDHLTSGGDWQKFYRCDPLDFYGSFEEKKLVIGGEACMWSEVVNSYSVIQRIFPRVSATAEKLWSVQNHSELLKIAERLEEHTCRMKLRGIPAQPASAAGIC